MKVNKLFKVMLNDIKREKSTYISLIAVVIISLFFGTLFITILKEADKKLIVSEITNFFDTVNSKNYVLSSNLLPNLVNNDVFLLVIFLLGLSIVGLPFIVCMLFYKGFTLAFTVTTLIYNFKFEGILFSFLYIFPHLILNLILYFIMCVYAFNLSIKIFKNILNKEDFKIKDQLKKYILVFIILILTLSISSLYETYIIPYIIKLIY